MPDINYRLNIDTTQLANSMSEVRSQLNMGLSAAGGGFIDTGRAALGGIYDMGNAAAAGGAALVSGMSNIPMPTMVHMDQGISFTPHYGVVNAQASLQAEWLGRFYGPAGVAPFTPPGVGPTEYYGTLMRGHERKFAEARTDAIIAGGGAVASFVSGEIGWQGGAAAGAAIGTMVAPGLGTAVGGLVGGLAGTFGATKLADVAIDEVKKSRQMTTDMAGIIDAHRMLPEGLQRELAKSALDAGRDMGMNAQQTADIIARMPQLGTMIPTTDLKAFGDQLRSVISDIRDFSSALHTSTGTAQTVMANMERFGFHGAEGADWLISQAGRIGAGVSPMQVYGMAMGGASMARNAQIGGGFGFTFMPDMAAEATHARLGREGLQMAGGVSGFAGALANNVLTNAFSPMGMLQMAAAPGRGFALPTSLEDTLDKGIGNMMDDFPRRFLALEVGRGEAIRAMGPGRTTQMAKQNLRNMVDMISPLMGPNANESDRELLGRHLLMQQGMNEYQAKGAAYRYLSTSAKDVANLPVTRALQEVRRNRALDHAAYAHSEAMEADADFIIPGLGHHLLGVKHFLEGVGQDASISEGKRIDAGTREDYLRAGVPYPDEDPQAVSDVQSGIISARGVKAPRSGTGLGIQVGQLAAIMGGNTSNVADMIHRGSALSDAVAGFDGDAKDLTLGRSGQAAARVFHREIMKDEAGFKRRLQDLSDALPGSDPKSIHEKLLAVVKGTEYESEIRRTGGLTKHASEAIPLLMAMAKEAGTTGQLAHIGLGDAVTENLQKYVASSYMSGVKKMSDGDKLKELTETLSMSSKRQAIESKTHGKQMGPPDADGSSAGLGDLANLIARQNQVLDGIVQEQRRMMNQNRSHKPNNKTHAGAN